MQGVPLKRFVEEYMCDSVARSVVFPLPLQQKWDLFEHYTRSQMAELRAGAAPRFLGEPGMYESISLSPDGEHIAFTARVDDRAEFAGVDLPNRPEGAQWTGEPKIVPACSYP